MILADTSIWVDMFRKGTFKAKLGNLIATDQLCIHPHVIAELALALSPIGKKLWPISISSPRYRSYAFPTCGR
jgi:predicted nucleic acid-binding protein